MSGESDESDKQYEPTQRKLDEARKKGEVPRSADLTTAAAYAGLLTVSLGFGAALLGKLTATLSGLLARADTVSAEVFSGGSQPVFGAVMLQTIAPLIPWFVLPALAALAAILAQRSFVVAPQKLMPRLSRISPIANAKNKFGRSGLFEFFKSFLKLTIFSVLLVVFLSGQLPQVLGAARIGPVAAVVLLLTLVVKFLAIVVVIAAAIGAVDFLWQYSEHMRRNRMSRKEMTDEAKQSDGDPHLKQRRRQKAQAIAMNQMMADVPQADVIIVNPEHYAVALKWERSSGAAPVCVAKGVDEVAARIRELAHEHAVPIHRDPPAARAIYATVDIGAEILPEHYKPVAAAIRFAEAMRQKARSPFGGANG